MVLSTLCKTEITERYHTSISKHPGALCCRLRAWEVSLRPYLLHFRQQLKDSLEQMLMVSMVTLLSSVFASCKQFVYAHIDL